MVRVDTCALVAICLTLCPASRHRLAANSFTVWENLFLGIFMLISR